ncbi:hypothetical protein BJ322DRAFT_348629 [Thelephora terrestris]|uniref:Zinc-finger domain-containing protein n=1 Tax=Thelephora terrestris TaxID=56493 RepID=A0A9P6H6B6_9AGAM|nr:hypothetical protein BJ322DRAFT_348629 [Thelephora terrestris]
MTMDDIINYQPWGPSIETMIDPALLSGTPAFSEPRFPSPAPAPFRDFHSRKRPRVHSPPPVHPALRIRIPPASTSQSNSAKSVRDSEGNSGGGKAKFYRKGTLQTPPHLSNSQGQRSVSAKTTPSTHVSRHLSPDHALDSPLTELSAWGPLASGTASTSSVALSSGMANIVDDDTTFINSDSGTPPRVTSAKATTSQNRKRSTNTEGPYRIVAVNENAFCHQCRRSSLHPKMSCRTCAKLYCILCIVKRYHDIEFQQFKKNFDCPACLDKCNCTSCCEKRKEVYITTRHIKFDKETMAKLLSGEIRSLPHLAASFSSSHEGPKSRRVLTSSVHRELPARKARTRRRRVTGRRYDTSDDDYDEDDESNVQDSSVRVKPAEAALQTQRMLEESGSGSHWGTVYSLNGERIGTSYVGNNLQNVTVQTAGFSSGSVTGHPPSRRNRVYAGRWQDAWGPRSEDSRSEDEISADKRGRNKKDLGRARIYYVGNHKIIKAWRKAQSKIVQSPPVLIPSSDDIHIPSPDPPSLDKAYDPHEATGALSSAFIQIGEEEEDASGNYWTMEDRSPPKERNLPFFASTNTPGLDLDNIYNVFDIRSTPTLESCEHLVSQEALAQVVASSLEAAGTTVLLSQQPLSLSTLSC